jgi:4-amino-4-deoxy-L-arabinose transferase-like glycosyltransferase
LAWLSIFLWTELSSLAGKSAFSIDSGREFMLVVCLISSALLYALGRRLGMGRPACAGAVVAFVFSPLAIFFHRAVLLDNPSIAWALAAFVLARDPKRRLGMFAASGACFAASVLSKETTLVLFPALAYAAFQNADRRTARYCITLFAAFFVVISLVYPLYAVLKGELVPGRGHVSLIGYTLVQLVTRKGTGSLFDPTSETHIIVAGWLGLDPWLLGGALLLAPLALARRSLRPIAVAFLLQCMTILRPGYLPNMYVIGLLPFAALIVAGAADTVWRWWRALGDRGTAWLVCPYILVPVLLALSAATGSWVRGDRAALTARPDAATRAADSWLVRHIGHRRRLIVTDDFWIYLIQHGFDATRMPGGFYSSTVISYWPLDFDPAVRRRFPGGWRDFDYVVLNQDMRVTLSNTPTAAGAVAHSRVVASFGTGSQLIQVRAIYDRIPGTP